MQFTQKNVFQPCWWFPKLHLPSGCHNKIPDRQKVTRRNNLFAIFSNTLPITSFEWFHLIHGSHGVLRLFPYLTTFEHFVSYILHNIKMISAFWWNVCWSEQFALLIFYHFFLLCSRKYVLDSLTLNDKVCGRDSSMIKRYEQFLFRWIHNSTKQKEICLCSAFVIFLCRQMMFLDIFSDIFLLFLFWWDKSFFGTKNDYCLKSQAREISSPIVGDGAN